MNSKKYYYTYSHILLPIFQTPNTFGNSEKSVLRLDLGQRELLTQKILKAIYQVQNTVYKIGAVMQEAPEITDCVTCIRYIVQEITGESFPLLYIGDMPRLLLHDNFLHASIKDLKEREIGDLVFFYGTSRFQTPMIRHVGIITQNTDIFFHSRQKTGGTFSEIKKSLPRVATQEQFWKSEDIRNKKRGL